MEVRRVSREAIVRSAYRAAIAHPESWPETLAGMRDHVGCTCVCLATSDAGGANFRRIASLLPAGAPPLRCAVDVRVLLDRAVTSRIDARAGGGAVCAVDDCVGAVVQADNCTAHVFAPAPGIAVVLCACWSAAGRRRRSAARRRFASVARVAEGALRLAAECRPPPADASDSWTSLLDLLPWAALVCTVDGTLVAANRMARALLAEGDGLVAADGRLHAARPRRDAALDSLRTGLGAGAATAMLLPRRGGGRPYVLELLALPAAATTAASPPAHCVLLVSDPSEALQLPPRMLRDLYGLTRREASVASLLACGLSVGVIAEELGIAIGTARLHLDHALKKTATHSQSELVRLLLASVPVPPKPRS